MQNFMVNLRISYGFKIFFTGLCTIFLMSSGSAAAQSQDVVRITWKTLQDVTFTEKYYKEAEAWFLFPNFGQSLRNLNGKIVEIKGYVIPIDAENGMYALSAFPFSSCYFCGGAGPESVMSLKLKKGHRRYRTDDVVTFRGRFELNDKDINDFNYILRQAEEVKP